MPVLALLPVTVSAITVSYASNAYGMCPAPGIQQQQDPFFQRAHLQLSAPPLLSTGNYSVATYGHM